MTKQKSVPPAAPQPATEPLELLELIRSALVDEFGNEANWPTRIVTVWSHAWVLAHDYGAAPQTPAEGDA